MINKEIVQMMDADMLVPFHNHPFKSRSGDENTQLTASIRQQGALAPLLVRPLPDGKYEVVSGHRRLEICKEIGEKSVPVIVRKMTDEEAVVAMVDANLQREKLLPSEKAYAFQMKMDALKKQGARADLTSPQVAAKFRTDDAVAASMGVSGDTVHRYIRLTHLIPELLKMVDEDRIAFTPAVELSFLTEKEQLELYSEMEYADATPSLSQAQRLKELSRQERLTRDAIYAVISEEKPNQKEQLRFRTEDIKKYFPAKYTPDDMQATIIKLLEKWQRSRERGAR